MGLAVKWRGVRDKLEGEGGARLRTKGEYLPYSGWVNTVTPRFSAPCSNGKNWGWERTLVSLTLDSDGYNILVDIQNTGKRER